MSKDLDRHKTKVGLRRKACEEILRDVVQCSEHKLDDSDKALLWDELVKGAKEVVR